MGKQLMVILLGAYLGQMFCPRGLMHWVLKVSNEYVKKQHTTVNIPDVMMI